MNEVQILRNGLSDSIDMLEDKELEAILGGIDIKCNKGYSYDEAHDTTSCNCGYVIKGDGDGKDPIFPAE